MIAVSQTFSGYIDQVSGELSRIFRPQPWLKEQLAAIKVLEPQTNWESVVNVSRHLPMFPWTKLGSLASRLQRQFPRGPQDPFCLFGPLINQDPEPRNYRLDLREMYGICASKSNIVPLSELSRTWEVNCILRRAEGDVSDLINQVLHGNFDCVARAGSPVRVIEQTWDGRLYVANDSGGSHRFAAIWRWHWEHDQPLIWDCAVYPVSLSDATLTAVATQRYWLLCLERPWDAEEVLTIAGDRSLFPDRQRFVPGIPFSSLNSQELGGPRECCIAYARQHPLAPVMDEWLEDSPALDLSAAILNLAACEH